MAMESHRTIRTFLPDDTSPLFALMRAVLEAGELPGTSLHDIETIRDRLAFAPESRFVALDGDTIVGFCSPSHEMLIVHPDERRRGHGTRLVEAALAWLRDTGRAELELAVPLGTPTAEPFARALGFEYHSSLFGFRLDPAVAVPAPAFPEGYATRFIRVPDDNARFVELFTRSFADHPSPVEISLEMVAHVHGLPDFDPTTIALLHPPASDDPAGFCRISLHDTDGEVEFIGVLPEYRGLGLGRELLRWGVAELRSRGAQAITLTVEARNDRALGLYERTGFTREHEWPRWTRRV